MAGVFANVSALPSFDSSTMAAALVFRWGGGPRMGNGWSAHGHKTPCGDFDYRPAPSCCRVQAVRQVLASCPAVIPFWRPCPALPRPALSCSANRNGSGTPAASWKCYNNTPAAEALKKSNVAYAVAGISAVRA
jgi:hypothetical protein